MILATNENKFIIIDTSRSGGSCNSQDYNKKCLVLLVPAWQHQLATSLGCRIRQEILLALLFWIPHSHLLLLFVDQAQFVFLFEESSSVIVR